MPSKEKMGELIEEWSWLLEGLGKAKYKLYKYSRIYENISKESNPSTRKLLLPVAYRVLRLKPDINISRSAKNSSAVFDIEKDDIDKMGIDEYMSFLNAISAMIVEKLNEENIDSIYSIRLEEEEDKYGLSVYY